MLLRGELPEVVAVAGRTGIHRSTLYRWFGDRDGLIGEVLSRCLARVLEEGYVRSRAQGGRRVARAIEALLEVAVEREWLFKLRHASPGVMLKVIMSPTGGVQRQLIASVVDLIERERNATGYEPILETRSVAFILTQIAQALVCTCTATGSAPDLREAMCVTEALLGATPSGSR